MYYPLKYVEDLPDTNEEIVFLMQDNMRAYQSTAVDWLQASIVLKNAFNDREYVLEISCEYKDKINPSRWIWRVWYMGTCLVSTSDMVVAIMLWKSKSLSI
jgi:hypothetical protein